VASRFGRTLSGRSVHKIVDALASCALDEGQSRDLIATLVVALYADREDNDGRDLSRR